jgi:hypothetical protein
MTTRKIRNQKTKDYRTTKEERIQEKERQTVQLCTKKQHTCTGGSGKRLWGNTSDSVHRRRWYQDTKWRRNTGEYDSRLQKDERRAEEVAEDGERQRRRRQLRRHGHGNKARDIRHSRKAWRDEPGSNRALILFLFYFFVFFLWFDALCVVIFLDNFSNPICWLLNYWHNLLAK